MAKGPYDFFKPGDWNARCDVCGRKFKGSMLLSRWDGLKTCKQCWEPRHPQDFVRGIPDNQMVPFIRHPPDEFVPSTAGTQAVMDGGYVDAGIIG